ncbi:MAG: hypothetical protein OEZ13_08610 [Spirochaetia bacterium]|nr:hypothetical protein [Spirochaetia bacterium]
MGSSFFQRDSYKFLLTFFFIYAALLVSYLLWGNVYLTWEDAIFRFWAENKTSLKSAFFYYFRNPQFLNSNLDDIHPNFPVISFFLKSFAYKGFIFIFSVLTALIAAVNMRKKIAFPVEFFIISLPLMFQNGAQLLILWLFMLIYIFFNQKIKTKKSKILNYILQPFFCFFYVPLTALFFTLNSRFQKKIKFTSLSLIFSSVFLFLAGCLLIIFVYRPAGSPFSFLYSLVFAYHKKDAVYKNLTFFSSFYEHHTYTIFAAGLFVLGLFYFLSGNFNVKKENFSFQKITRRFFLPALPALFYLFISNAEMPVFLYLFMFAFIPLKYPPFKKRVLPISLSLIILLIHIFFLESESNIRADSQNNAGKQYWVCSLQDMPSFKINTENIEYVDIVDIKIIDENINAAADILKKSFLNIEKFDFLTEEQKYSENIFQNISSRENVYFFMKTNIHPLREKRPYRRARLWHEKWEKNGEISRARFFCR